MPNKQLTSSNKRTAQAKQAKALQLPMSRESAESLALSVHVALDMMRRGSGTSHAIQVLTHATLLVGAIALAGKLELPNDLMNAAQEALAESVTQGVDIDEWRLSSEGFEVLARVVSAFDNQLRLASVAALSEANRYVRAIRESPAVQQGVAQIAAATES